MAANVAGNATPSKLLHPKKAPKLMASNPLQAAVAVEGNFTKHLTIFIGGHTIRSSSLIRFVSPRNVLLRSQQLCAATVVKRVHLGLPPAAPGQQG
jgi:hypothetical protein